MNLTPAQLDALQVLADNDPGWLEGWKRRTVAYPVPRVNMRAAGSLVEKRLARSSWPLHSNPYTHDERYRITDKGRLALRARELLD